MYDSIIIGSGPAGITASLYMIRAGLKILIISKNQTALLSSDIDPPECGVSLTNYYIILFNNFRVCVWIPENIKEFI